MASHRKCRSLIFYGKVPDGPLALPRARTSPSSDARRSHASPLLCALIISVDELPYRNYPHVSAAYTVRGCSSSPSHIKTPTLLEGFSPLALPHNGPLAILTFFSFAPHSHRALRVLPGPRLMQFQCCHPLIARSHASTHPLADQHTRAIEFVSRFGVSRRTVPQSGIAFEGFSSPQGPIVIRIDTTHLYYSTNRQMVAFIFDRVGQ